MSFQTSALILSWIAILLLALVVSGLVRQVHALSSGMVQRPPEAVGLPAGATAPGFARLAPTPLAVPLVLLFLDPDCGTCGEVLAEAAGRVSRGGPEFRALYRDSASPRAAGLPITVLDGQAELFERYDVLATPFATVVDPAGRVLRAEPIGSRAALRRLIDSLDSPPPGGSGPAVATSHHGGRA
ncbi:hypothetical protein GA0074692_2375 [Micromonospora pallida]|uniref:Thioredoxin domain-containing protein n=1 Tax=Micromonospora pallida TaxID=145854 RepID=A0A1C6SDM4_9ACTN|nr:hypothetical protein [Micromonospora pallida]SCL27580.1 hypothetical protein GA0074692_2375 [Micromonospora pallida]